MKAKQWAERLKTEGVNLEEIFSAFAVETRSLVEERSKYSTDLRSKGYAKDGALREQKQKWLAVLRLVPSVSVSFDEVLTTKLVDVKLDQDKWTASLAKAAQAEEAAEVEPVVITDKPAVVNKAKPRKGLPGRELADSLKKA